VSSLKGIGLKKAIETLGKYGSMEKAVQHWQTWGKLAKAPTIRKGYLREIIMAERTFLHQRVYDPLLKMLVFLNELPNDGSLSGDDMNYVGP
jgi:5'-3' exonuclease